MRARVNTPREIYRRPKYAGPIRRLIYSRIAAKRGNFRVDFSWEGPSRRLPRARARYRRVFRIRSLSQLRNFEFRTKRSHGGRRRVSRGEERRGGGYSPAKRTLKSFETVRSSIYSSSEASKIRRKQELESIAAPSGGKGGGGGGGGCRRWWWCCCRRWWSWGCIVARYREGRRVSNNGSQPPCRPTKLI